MRKSRASIRLPKFALIVMLSIVALPAAVDRLSADIETAYVKEINYRDYLELHQTAPRPELEILIPGAPYSAASSDVQILSGIGSYGEPTAVTGETGFVEWSVDVPEAGLYNIEVSYYPVEGRGSNIEREIRINGKRPFEGAGYLSFFRVWTDKSQIRIDVDGNEIRAPQVEDPQWIQSALRDSRGFELVPYKFFFNEGSNSVRFVSLSEPMAIRWIRLFQAEPAPSYSEKKSEYEDNGYRASEGVLLKLQERDASFRSSASLYPVFDQGEPTAEPYHPAEIRLNAIGGYRWVNIGEWISWSFEVPQSGLYKIALKAKQDMLRGLYSNRKLLIDGSVPFAEAEGIRFPFSQNYRMYPITAGESEDPALFFLEKGKHELTLEIVLGDLADFVEEAEDIILQLYTIYRRIIVVTSPNPDPLRTYQLEKRIPSVIEEIEEQSVRIREIASRLEAITGEKGGQVALLNRLVILMERMHEKPDLIPRLLSEFRDNTTTFSIWVVDTRRNQALLIDYLLIASPDQELPDVNTGFGRVLKHEANAFISSFTHDYSRIGNMVEPEDKSAETIKVWIGSGRDQAQIVKELIEESFTPASGIMVDLELVQSVSRNTTGTATGAATADVLGNLLIPSILAGRAPDVAIGAADMDLAYRGALANLTDFPDFPDIAKRFFKSAFVPFRFRDEVYALPEAQTLRMLFYRLDILDELGLDIPETWEDVYRIIPELQKYNLDFGIPADMGTFLMFLYQQGVAFFKEDSIATNLDSEAAVNSFNNLTDLFTLYSLPLVYNQGYRFFLGEMPLVLADTSLFNILTVYGSSLRGDWGFTLLPGTRMPDGTINRTAAVTAAIPQPGETPGVNTSLGTYGAVILQQSEKKEASWEFLKWWTSADIQYRFGREMEILMGTAARYATANVEAFMRLPWRTDQREKILAQWEWAEGVPPVLGYYYVNRQFYWLLRAIVIRNEPLRETIIKYNRPINEEIARKRKEFGYPVRIEDVDEEWKRLYWQQYTHVDRLE